MPRNQRPGGLFGEFDYGWEGTTLNERIQAQNIWDLLEAQEKANQIEQEKLNLMKEQAYENSLSQKEELQDQDKQDQEDYRRRLCEDLGISYIDFKEFLSIYNIDKEEIKRQIILESIKEGQKVIDELKENLENLEPNTKKLKRKVERIKSENTKLSKSIISRSLNKAKIKDNEETITAIEAQIKKVEDEFKNSKDNIKAEIEDKIKNYTTNINELQDYLNKPNDMKTVKQDFEEFRKNHYNKDVELLFKRFGIELPKLEVSQDRGTIEEYNEYFKTKILEN